MAFGLLYEIIWYWWIYYLNNEPQTYVLSIFNASKNLSIKIFINLIANLLRVRDLWTPDVKVKPIKSIV